MNRLLTIIILIPCSLMCSIAQESDTDSLKQLLSRIQSETLETEVLIQLGESLKLKNPNESIKYARRAAKIAAEHGDMDKLITAKVLFGIYFQRNGMYDSALYHLNSALQISRDTGNKRGMSRSLQRIGLVYSSKSNYALAEGYYQEALEIQIALGEKAGLASLLKDFGVIYMDQGYYHTALDYAQRALEIYQSLNDKEGISNEYNNIAMIYGHRQEYSKALEYFQKSLVLNREMKNKLGEKTALNNIGYILKQQNKFDLALKHLFEAVDLLKEIGLRCDDHYPIYNIGSIYEITDRLDSAEHYLKNALTKARECSDQYIITLSLISLGNLEMKTNNFAIAKNLYNQAFEIASKASLKAEMKDASQSLAVLYESLEQPLEALEHYKTYHSIKDSIFSQENTSKLARLEARYEFEQERKETELLQKIDRFEQDKKLQDAIWLRNSFILGFAVMLLVCFLIYRIYQKQRRSHEELNELNAEIEIQKEELLDKAKDLKNANEEISRMNENLENMVSDRTRVITAQNNKILDYVFYNSHQVRGPLSRILGLTSLFHNNAIDKNETNQILQDIDSAAVELDGMVKSMSETLENEKKYIENSSKDS